MRSYFTFALFLLLFGCGGDESVLQDNTFSGDPDCMENFGYYKEGCLISDADQQAVDFSLCTGTDDFLASHDYSTLSDLKGKVILLEMSASW